MGSSLLELHWSGALLATSLLLSFVLCSQAAENNTINEVRSKSTDEENPSLGSQGEGAEEITIYVFCGLISVGSVVGILHQLYIERQKKSRFCDIGLHESSMTVAEDGDEMFYEPDEFDVQKMMVEEGAVSGNLEAGHLEPPPSDFIVDSELSAAREAGTEEERESAPPQGSIASALNWMGKKIAAMKGPKSAGEFANEENPLRDPLTEDSTNQGAARARKSVGSVLDSLEPELETTDPTIQTQAGTRTRSVNFGAAADSSEPDLDSFDAIIPPPAGTDHKEKRFSLGGLADALEEGGDEFQIVDIDPLRDRQEVESAAASAATFPEASISSFPVSTEETELRSGDKSSDEYDSANSEVAASEASMKL